MSPESLRHALLVKYVLQLVDAYLALNPIGLVLDDPFVMRLDTSNTYREPDVLVILKTNPGQLTNIALIGPADLCVEVVSPESATRDYGDKFIEYEKAGVREYWIIDPLRQRVQFNRLDAAGVYTAIQPDEADRYTTPLLPRLYVHVPTLWQDTLPNAVEIMQMVQAMLAE
jgi:Uma2 family endonuclease